VSVSSFLSYVCVCISPVSQLFEIAFSTSLAETSMCTCVRACVCVYTDVFFRVRARRTFPETSHREERLFYNCFFQRPFPLSLGVMVYTLIPGHKLKFQFFHKKSSSRKFVPKTSQQHSSSPTQFEKSLEDERNVSPRDVITRRATTTSSGARRCC